MANIKEQFGSGIVCPFQRDGKGDFANDTGLRLLKSDIGELLGIVGPSNIEPGELPWDPDRGSRIDTLRHRGLHTEMTRALAEQYTSETIRRYENRVLVGPTKVSDENDTTLRVDFSFAPKGVQEGELETVPILVEK